jgi:hypothetical protein
LKPHLTEENKVVFFVHAILEEVYPVAQQHDGKFRFKDMYGWLMGLTSLMKSGSIFSLQITTKAKAR